MNTFVIGDIHGEVDKLKDVFFNAKEDLKDGPSGGDRIIFLGDYVDRGKDSYGVVEFITELSLNYEVITIKGNHDSEFIYGLENGYYPLYSQGTKETIISYLENCYPDGLVHERSNLSMEHLPGHHISFYKNLKQYFLDEEGNLFVHGGINRHKFLEEQDEVIFLWDRDLLASARSYTSMKNNEYPFKIKDDRIKKIFLGHTPVQYFDKTSPQTYGPVTLLDLGAGKFKEGKVCIYNVNKNIYWTND